MEGIAEESILCVDVCWLGCVCSQALRCIFMFVLILHYVIAASPVVIFWVRCRG
jgi:hypothetical protein